MRIKFILLLLISVVIVGCSHQPEHTAIQNAGGKMHTMAAKGDIEGLRKALQSGIDVNTRDAAKTNFSPLHYAAWQGEYETSKFLIANGANINAKSYSDNTPLHYAAGKENRCHGGGNLSEGHFQTVKLLINHGAEIDPRNGRGETPLQNAAECDALDIARLLIAHGANVNNRSNQYSVLETARRDIAFLLINSGAKVDTFEKYTGDSPLTLAIENQDMELVEVILQRGVDLNRRHGTFPSTPLGRAVDNAPSRFVELLLKAGADPNLETCFKSRCYFPPLVIAVKNRDASSLRLLIQYGAEIPAIEPETGKPLLHYAVEHNAVDVVRVLLENNVDVNTTTDESLTTLHRAALEDYAEMVELLLNYGADPNAEHQGRKPRDMAWKPEVIAIFDRFQKTK